MYFLTSFSLLFYLEFKRLAFLKPQIVKGPAERRQMFHTPQSISSSFQKPLLEFILGRPAVAWALDVQEVVFWGWRGWGGQPSRAWLQGLRGQSKPYQMSTPLATPDVSVAHSFLPFSFLLLTITPFLFSFFSETDPNRQLPSILHAHPTVPNHKCPTNRERFEPLSDRPGRPQTSSLLWGLTWVCRRFFTPGAAAAFVGSSV